jgi:tetratricopeptide (TPR) repeat protein
MQPGPQPFGLRKRAEVLRQQQPGDLADVTGVSGAETVSAGNIPDHPTVPLHELIPGNLIAVAGPRNQLRSRSRRLEVLELAPFDREDLGLLLGGILGGLPSPATVQRIFARSGGNAFLAEELLAAETDQPGQELPRRLQGILLARVAALAEDTRHVLRLTATVGRPIEHHLLAAAAQLPESRLLAATREAVDRQVLRAERDRYGFRHVLLQQAVYGELLPGERLGLHAAVARALTDDPHAKVRRQTAAELAHHWHVARDHSRALTASIAAGRAAADVYGFTEAHQQYERAFALWDQVSDAPEQAGLTLADLRLEAAEAAGWAGLADRAATLIQEALADMGSRVAPARAGVLRARLAEWLWDAGDTKAALATYEEASRLVANDPPSAGKARVLAGHATELMRQCQFSASRVLSEDAIAVARAVGAIAEEGEPSTPWDATFRSWATPRRASPLCGKRSCSSSRPGTSTTSSGPISTSATCWAWMRDARTRGCRSSNRASRDCGSSGLSWPCLATRSAPTWQGPCGPWAAGRSSKTS